MDKDTAVQNAVNAIAVATQARNDYGPNSSEHTGAHTAAVQKTLAARQAGANDTDFRTTRPA